MGLFDFFGGTPSNDSETPSEGIVKGRDSTFPRVYIKRLKPHVNGGHLQLYCSIANEWPREVELDKIRIFNTKRELDYIMRARDEREFLVYDGPALTREYAHAELEYKTMKEGDYFQTVYRITFAYNASDKTYLPSDAHLDGPIRDINELT
jgi:hypothetical protein